MELGDRKLKILQAIVDDYILTAVPVGSRTLSKKYLTGISSATIRNEMSDLEEMGYLEQPHTSAGRIPSDKAYRLYVDRLMQVRGLNEQEASSISAHFNRRMDGVLEVMQKAADALGDATQYTALVLSPRMDEVPVRHVQLVPVSPGLMLLVVVTDAGIYKDAMLRVSESFDADYLYQMSKMLTEVFQGHTFSQIAEQIMPRLAAQAERHKLLFGVIAQAMRYNTEQEKQTPQVVLGGANNIFHYPEYNDVSKAREFLALLEGKDQLANLLTSRGNLEFSVTIGTENPIASFQDYSVVTATYHIGGKSLGSFGVIGPTRMQYGRVVSVMDYLTHSLEEIFRNLGGFEGSDTT